MLSRPFLRNLNIFSCFKSILQKFGMSAEFRYLAKGRTTDVCLTINITKCSLIGVHVKAQCAILFFTYHSTNLDSYIKRINHLPIDT